MEMSNIREKDERNVNESIHETNDIRPLLQLPSTEGVRTIQRNRRGPMIRPSASNSMKYFTGNRDYKDHSDSRRKNNRTNRDHESLIESLLRQPLDNRLPSKGNSTFSHQTDRYGPPVGEEDGFLERYDATAPSPSVIFTVPCYSKGKIVQVSCRNLAFLRALVLFLGLSILIIVVTVTNRLMSVDGRLNAGNIRYSGGEGVMSKMTHNNNTNPLITEKEVTAHMTNLEQRISVISKDTTIDIGFGTDDMIFDQSTSKAGKGIDLNDDRSDFSNDANNTVASMKKGESPIDEKSKEINKNNAMVTQKEQDTNESRNADKSDENP